MYWYLVKHCCGRSITVKADNGAQAKRKACKYWGFRPSDYWLGLTGMHAERTGAAA